MVIGVLNVDPVAIGQNGLLEDPFHLRFRFADVVDGPLVASTDLDGHRLEVLTNDARLDCWEEEEGGGGRVYTTVLIGSN